MTNPIPQDVIEDAKTAGFTDGLLAWQEVTEKLVKFSELQRARQVVPEGWKLVPIEPNEEILKKMTVIIDQQYNSANYKYMYKALHTYKAMLAAAPQPAKQQAKEASESKPVLTHRKFPDGFAYWIWLNGYEPTVGDLLFLAPPQPESVATALRKAAEIVRKQIGHRLADEIIALIDKENEA